MSLEKEMQSFQKAIDGLLAQKHGGKFALVSGETVLGTFTTFDEAYSEGVKRFGKGEFLVKQIVKNPTPENFPSLMFGLTRADL